MKMIEAVVGEEVLLLSGITISNQSRGLRRTNTDKAAESELFFFEKEKLEEGCK